MKQIILTAAICVLFALQGSAQQHESDKQVKDAHSDRMARRIAR